ncbi:unnamed protein product [Ectocarpus sp. 12 AP-2014]
MDAHHPVLSLLSCVVNIHSSCWLTPARCANHMPQGVAWLPSTDSSRNHTHLSPTAVTNNVTTSIARDQSNLRAGLPTRPRFAGICGRDAEIACSHKLVVSHLFARLHVWERD